MLKKLLCFLFMMTSLLSAENSLKANLERSRVGDFVVTSQGGNYSLLSIHEKSPNSLTLEEITVPCRRISKHPFNWKNWVEHQAPGHTSWVLFEIDRGTGKVTKAYSFTKKSWLKTEAMDNFLSKLLTLEMQKIPFEKRRRIGAPPRPGFPDQRRIWQPKMVFEGQEVRDVFFEAWKTHWPKDGGPLSDKQITVYILQENDKYPSYFPYWLQVAGLVGKARVHIIDSGASLASPKTLSPQKGS